MNRKYHSRAISFLMDDWDDYDPWGSAMSAAWTVAEVARAVDVLEIESILEITWNCVPVIDLSEAAASLDDRDNNGDVSFGTAILAAAYLSGDVTDDDLLFVARVLSRYLNLCRAAGLDY
jgi:hypothetical protein